MQLLDGSKAMAATYKSAIDRLVAHLDQQFLKAVDMLLAAKGQAVVCGMGKSGLFGQKISSSFASTGTPSIFLHPAEAIHGDLGRVRADDVLLLISHSGETEELIRLLPAFDRIGAPAIAFTGDLNSSLAKYAKAVLDISVDKEACPLNLAPTTSGVTTLVMGDALAVALMERRGFDSEDFAATHPGGTLGRRLLTRVRDKMITAPLPFVAADMLMNEVILRMTECRLGLALVGSAEGLDGIITDGDLRRALVEGCDFAKTRAQQLMSPAPLTISPDARFAEAEDKMQENRVQCLAVVDTSGKVAGVVQIFQPL
ncbi:MAG: KpsF/GutQ family sugar-phosphate isomerase [Proteobacteria bacterium]|nr:KpsF/GutQ family sugar-phosphate isomerase [Pseudomonadota bacterium]